MKRRLGNSTVRISVFILVFGLGPLSLALAQQPKAQAKEAPGHASTLKELQGEVTWISKAKDRIAIVFQRQGGGEEEILLPIGKDVQLQHIKSLDELKVADVVSIQFEESNELGPDGPRTTRKAKAIIFVRPGLKKPTGTTLQSGQ